MAPNQAPYEKIPYFSRRPPGFYWQWDSAIFSHPYVPSGYSAAVAVFSGARRQHLLGLLRLLPRGVGREDPDRSHPTVARSPSSPIDLSRLSVIGGTFIALLTLLSWLGAATRLWRQPSDPRTVLLIIPLLALLGQMHFATKYPNDDFGPIKGAYMQFVAPILCGLFGLAVAWMWRRVWARAGAIAALGALFLVFALHRRLPPPALRPGRVSGRAVFLTETERRYRLGIAANVATPRRGQTDGRPGNSRSRPVPGWKAAGAIDPKPGRRHRLGCAGRRPSRRNRGHR